MKQTDVFFAIFAAAFGMLQTLHVQHVCFPSPLSKAFYANGANLGSFKFGNFRNITLQEINISPEKSILKMIFLFPRWDMLIPWRVYFHAILFNHFLRGPLLCRSFRAVRASGDFKDVEVFTHELHDHPDHQYLFAVSLEKRMMIEIVRSRYLYLFESCHRRVEKLHRRLHH